MKGLKFIFLLLAAMGFNKVSYAANIELEEIIQAEHIEELSQKVAILYIYVHERMNIAYSQKEFKKSLLLLDRTIKNFNANSNPEIEGLVEFMKFTYDELKLIINEPFSKENAAFIIDYSESLLEASEGIKSVALSKISMTKDLQMSVKLHEMENLVERANRYYIAFHIGLKDDNNLNQMVNTLSAFNKNLKYINTYKYTGKEAKTLNSVKKVWKSTQSFFKKIEENSLPRVVLSSSTYLTKLIDQLATFHEKKLGE